jgi:hypothetical protein
VLGLMVVWRPAHLGGGLRTTDPHAGGMRSQDLPANVGARAERWRHHRFCFEMLTCGSHMAEKKMRAHFSAPEVEREI